MEEIYIKVNNEFIKINKMDINEIIIPIITSLIKFNKYKNISINYSVVGNKLKQKCNEFGFLIYNKNKKRRNINAYLHKEYNGIEKYIKSNIK